MKKLTAGIFATLLAVVSADSAYAAIASSGYVDDKVGEVSQTVTTLSGTVSEHTTQIGTINTNLDKKADKATTLEGYGITDAYTSAKGTALEGRVAAVEAPKAQVAADETGPVSGGTVYTAIQGVSGDVSGVTSDVATLKSDMTEAKADISALETASANHVVKNEAITAGTHTKITYDAKGLVTAGANLTADDIPTIPNTKVSGLGSLATKSAVSSAEITDGTITEADLNTTINASLDKADSALQQTDLADYVTKEAADAAYADIATETTASTASTNAQTALTNIGTLSQLTTEAKDNTVEAINEVATEAAAAASAASTADTKAGQAQSAATAAQGEVDALEAVVNNETTGLAAAHTAIDALESGKLDKTGTAARATADASGNVITTTYATKAEIADLATDENLALKQDKTDNSLATTNKTVVGAINEVKTQADKGVSDAATAKSAAEAAQTAADSKLPTATYNTQVGTVSATNMGTTASTVVTAIKEVAGEASTAQSTATAAQQTATQAQQIANAAIPAPTAACAEPDNKCVLVSAGAGNYSWEVIARGDAE